MADGEPSPPGIIWRAGSVAVMGFIGSLSRAFMNGANTQDAYGLDGFLDLVNSRVDVNKRERGLITVSNHISVIDDPLIWGTLPFSYHFNPSNSRWSLGSHDICFTNKPLSLFFSMGQTLPTHRLQHSPHGGLFQPTMREAIRLLSCQPYDFNASWTTPPRSSATIDPRSPQFELTDPFSSAHHQYTYSTTGLDTFPAPSAFATRQYSWIHIFPEGKVHQHPNRTMRYFKWGVARLILEPEVCPDIIPMWISGNDEIMHEARTWPRFIPRTRKRCEVWFGNNIRGQERFAFEDLRQKWRELIKTRTTHGSDAMTLELGTLDDELKYGKEAVALREECTKRVRQAVLQVRQLSGLPDEDPKAGLVETWRQEGAKTEGKMADGSYVKDA